MFDIGGTAVATGGRPKKEDGKGKTKHVRINDDLAEMLSWVLQVLGKDHSSAKVLDPHIRGPITALYNLHKTAIDGLRLAQNRAAKSQRRVEEG